MQGTIKIPKFLPISCNDLNPNITSSHYLKSPHSKTNEQVIRIKSPSIAKNLSKVSLKIKTIPSKYVGTSLQKPTVFSNFQKFDGIKIHRTKDASLFKVSKNNSIEQLLNAKSQPSSPMGHSKNKLVDTGTKHTLRVPDDFKQTLKKQLCIISKLIDQEEITSFADTLIDLLQALFSQIAYSDTTLSKHMEMLSEYVRQLNLIVQNASSKFDNTNALLQLQKITYENNELKRKLTNKKLKLKQIKSISHQTTIILNETQKNFSRDSSSFKIINEPNKGTEPNSPGKRVQFEPPSGTERTTKRFSIPKLDMRKLEKYKREHRMGDFNKEVKDRVDNESDWVLKNRLD